MSIQVSKIASIRKGLLENIEYMRAELDKE